VYVAGCVGVTGQEAVLSISVKFADGTLTPLHYISPADYQLDVDTLNNHVVAFADPSSPDAAADWPRLMAVGAGSGELVKVSLQAAGACRRRKARPLAVTYAVVDIDLAGPLQSSTDAVQNDAAAAAAAAAVSAAGVRGGRLRPLRADHDKPALHLSLNHGHPGQSGGTDEKVMS